MIRKMLALLAPVLLSGCAQVEVTIDMRDDVGAVVTERLRFSGRLLELDSENAPEQRLATRLEKEAAVARTSYWGKGAQLTDHKLSKVEHGGMESVSVYTIPELSDLRLFNPFWDSGPPDRTMRLNLEPFYTHSFRGPAGVVELGLAPAEKAPQNASQEDAKVKGGTAPLHMQALRELMPMFRDLLKDFQVTVHLINSQPIVKGYYRDQQSGSKTMTLLSFTSEDLDAHGNKFLENEELLLALLRFDFNSELLAKHTGSFFSNKSVPLFRSKGFWYSQGFQVKPTGHLFKKFFAGRPKAEGGDK